MSWRSLEELSTEFDLDTRTDPEAMRRALQRRLATLHPDKTGGGFASNEQEGEYHRVSEALQFLESHASIPTALVTNEEMSTRTLRCLEQIEQSLARSCSSAASQYFPGSSCAHSGMFPCSLCSSSSPSFS